MDSERQPPFPQLYNCRYLGETCAITGCYFDNIRARILAKSGKLGNEATQEVLEDLEAMHRSSGCKKLSKG